MYSRIDEAIANGYDGMYLDIVDAYEVSQVANAYVGPGNVRQAMIDFVTALSGDAKAIDPDFKVIPQNAVGLLALNESNPGVPNAAYLGVIDGIGVEDLWYNGNKVSSWTADDLAFLQNAVHADKFVLATSYPTQDAKQDIFITNAINEGFIPFVGNRELTGVIDPSDLTIEARMAGHDIDTPWGLPPLPPANGDPLITSNGGGETAHLSLAENASAVTTVTAIALDPQLLSYSILLADGANGAGADGERFQINAGTGALSFIVAPDFESPGDAGADNVYDVTVQAVSGQGVLDTQALSVTVTDVAGITKTSNAATIAGTGENDVLTGGSNANTLLGLSGNDGLAGKGASDVLNGGDGNDRLTGGAGIDALTGGHGADVFIFDSVADIGNSTVAGGRELVTDFEAGDKIDLFAIDPNTAMSGNQPFALVQAIAAAGQVSAHYDQNANQTIIEGNINSNVNPDFRLAIVGSHPLTADDFIL